ncbi:MAG: orotidine-5'-phosphate decarboxylase [Rhodospirillales bacterium]|nr:orotidine-5'-phosphate decarboxylase [Rhodospirillales bacterium]
MKPTDRIFTALDTTDIDHAVSLARNLTGHVGGAKVGKEFFTANGPDGVRRVSDTGMPVFIDLKWHDIPNTVAGAVRASLPLKPAIVNVHAAGGAAMLHAAAGAAAEAGDDRPLVLAVTVLTSLDDDDLHAIGVDTDVTTQVVRLARLSQDNGIDGVVCSAREIEALREACGPEFKLLVPGIRPTWAAIGDQKRVMTPKEAIAKGADYLVIGRPITGADDPVAAAERIADELD